MTRCKSFLFWTYKRTIELYKWSYYNTSREAGWVTFLPEAGFGRALPKTISSSYPGFILSNIKIETYWKKLRRRPSLGRCHRWCSLVARGPTLNTAVKHGVVAIRAVEIMQLICFRGVFNRWYVFEPIFFPNVKLDLRLPANSKWFEQKLRVNVCGKKKLVINYKIRS